MLFGKTKIFFRDFAYTILLKKYAKFYEYINLQAHRLTSLFIKNSYVNKRDRKIKFKKTIAQYCKGLA